MDDKAESHIYLHYSLNWPNCCMHFVSSRTLDALVASIVRYGQFLLSGRRCNPLCILLGNSLYDSDVRTNSKVPEAKAEIDTISKVWKKVCLFNLSV